MEDLISQPTDSFELTDIDNKFGENLQFIEYTDLKELDEKEFLNMLPLIVYYRNSDDFGHFTLVHIVPHKKSTAIEFFNSYGEELDSYFYDDTNTGAQVRKYNIYPYLTDLFINCGLKLTYNQFHFQKRGDNINTCGKHCVARLINNCYDLIKYKKAFDNTCKRMGHDYDYVVSSYYEKYKSL